MPTNFKLKQFKKNSVAQDVIESMQKIEADSWEKFEALAMAYIFLKDKDKIIEYNKKYLESLEQSAKDGDAYAQFKFSYTFYPNEQAQAFFWMYQSAMNGFSVSKLVLNDLKKSLSKEDEKEVIKLINAYMKSNK